MRYEDINGVELNTLQLEDVFTKYHLFYPYLKKLTKNHKGEIFNEFAECLQALTNKRGKCLSNQSLARALRKKESEISKWMTGTHNFTIKTLAKISAVFGEPVIQVINDQQILSKENPSEQKLSILRESEAKYRGKKG